MTRREFVVGGTAAALVGCKTGLTGASSSRLRLGVLSDIHVSCGEFCRDGHDRLFLSTAAVFERALRYFRARGVDAVVIAGDLTEYGMVAELEKVAETWRRVFPDDCGKDGEKVAKLFILGNHDAIAWGWKSGWYGGLWTGAEKEAKWRASIARDPAAAWRKCFDEPYAPLEIREVKGYRFVLGHWLPDDPGRRKWSEGADVPGLGAFLERHRPALEGPLPFFYVQHAHPKGTCLPFAAGDRGGSTAALSRFPNAVAFSGHAHQPLTDERGLWQGAFVSIGTASLVDAGGRDDRENGSPYASGTVECPLEKHLDTTECRQGLYVTVEDARLTIERRDFTWGLAVGPAWTVPSVPSEPPPPRFPDAAALVATVEERDVLLRFPSANAGGRTYDYEVRAVLEADDYESVAASRHILAPDYHLPAEKADRPADIRFPLNVLPHGRTVRFEVVPVSCRGVAGKPLSRKVNLPASFGD